MERPASTHEQSAHGRNDSITRRALTRQRKQAARAVRQRAARGLESYPSWIGVAGLIFGALVLIGIVGGIWWGADWALGLRKDAPYQPTHVVDPADSPDSLAKVPTSMGLYTAPDFGIQFDYPSNWTVVDRGNGSLRAVSPAVRLVDANGKETAGEIILSIYKKGVAPAELNRPTLASSEAAHVTYANPSPYQRRDTFVVPVRYKTTSAGIDAVYVTGGTSYRAGQIVPFSQLSEADPLLIFSFERCGNIRCAGTTTHLTIQQASWRPGDDPAAPINRIIASLSAQ